MSSSSPSSKIFIGNPSLDEIKNFFLREKKLADIRFLERKIELEQKDTSPELSESFEIYLEENKKKAKAEKLKLAAEEEKAKMTKEKEEEVVARKKDDSISEDSFLEMEKFCENTLTLNNVSENFADLTSMEGSNISLMFEEMCRKQRAKTEEKSFLHEIEPPSMLMNNTLFNSPNNSPFKTVNRPSTIMEVSELSTSIKSGLTSYQTANAYSVTDKSECYQTACDDDDDNKDDTWSNQESEKRDELSLHFKGSMNFTKDSLEVTKPPNDEQSTLQDSLDNKENVTIGDEASFDLMGDKSLRFNDTLDEIEFILSQGNKLKDLQKTPLAKIDSANVTPKQDAKPWSPSPWSLPRQIQSTLSAKPKVLSPRTPLFKLSPAPSNQSPSSNFKLPKHPLSSSKTPQFTSVNNKKFQHIVSPISQYIKNTPDVPLGANAHTHQYGIASGGARHFNFRDSESFSAEKSIIKPSSLPVRAKTASSKQVLSVQPSVNKKIPGGSKIQNLLGTSPSVVYHKKDVAMSSSKMFHDNTLMSEHSSIFDEEENVSKAVDASILVVEEIKRLK